MKKAKNTDEHSEKSSSTREEPPQPKQIAGSLAVASEITLVYQYANPDSGVYRSFIEHCIAGRKYLRPLGLGAGVPVLCCHEESERKRIATRRQLISERDPYETTRKRANANVRDYILLRKDRIERSLVTREGQHALWSELEPKTQVVVIDSLEGFTRASGKIATGHSTTAPLSELLGRLTARGIAVVIFAKALGRNKMEPPAWLDGLTCNMVYIEEDRNNPMPGRARLICYRNAINELDRAPRRFAWWWTVDDDKLDFSCREEHFAEPVLPTQKARDVRREEIKAWIAEGMTTQKELADHIGVSPSTVNRGALPEMIESGEVLMDPKTKKLSLPASDAPLAEGTNDSGNDDDAPDEDEDSSPAMPDKGTNEPIPAPKEDRDPEDEPW
jgi:hypothetical protein